MVANLASFESLFDVSLVGQMHLCLKSLDAIGASVSAAHLSAAIDALRHQAVVGELVTTDICLTINRDFELMDRMADEIFGISGG